MVYVAIRGLTGPDDGRYDIYESFFHDYVVSDAAGDPVLAFEFTLTYSRSDFSDYWVVDIGEADQFREAGTLLTVTFEALEDDVGHEYCLTEPLLFEWVDTGEGAAQIPEGTCLENDGESQVVLRR